MTEEKLKRGRKLLDDIEYYSKQKKLWEISKEFASITLREGGDYRSYENNVNPHFINFDETKLLVLAKIQKAIDELHDEFDNL